MTQCHAAGAGWEGGDGHRCQSGRRLPDRKGDAVQILRSDLQRLCAFGLAVMYRVHASRAADLTRAPNVLALAHRIWPRMGARCTWCAAMSRRAGTPSRRSCKPQASAISAGELRRSWLGIAEGRICSEEEPWLPQHTPTSRSCCEVSQAVPLWTAGNQDVHLSLCDVSSLDSVRMFAAEHERSGKSLHLLINNAGILVWPLSATRRKQ